MATDVKAGRQEPEMTRRITGAAAALARTDISKNKWVQGALIASYFFFIYFETSNVSSPYDQYVRLADSFLHGRLYLLQPPDYLELARYFDSGTACTGFEAGCKGYVIDPPAPAVLLMPFVALFGVSLNQVLVSIAFGSAAIGLFWVATRRMGWNLQLRAAMTVLLGVGTNFWWAAGDGSLWGFAHVSSMFFMMAAMVAATGQKSPLLVGALVGLSGLSRLATFLAFPFFLYLVLEADIRDWKEWRAIVWNRRAIRKVLLFGGALGAMACVVLLYNYARFHTILDGGYRHPQYESLWAGQGPLNISHIPTHIDGIFFFSPVSNGGQFPFFKPSALGMGLFMVTPAFLYAYGALAKRREVAAAVSMGLVMIPQVLYVVTGGGFGYRFSLDYVPMLLVLTASGMGHRVGIRKWLLIGLSVFMAMWGPLFFFDTRLEDLLGLQWKL
jgi:hypothetical protein